MVHEQNQCGSSCKSLAIAHDEDSSWTHSAKLWHFFILRALEKNNKDEISFVVFEIDDNKNVQANKLLLNYGLLQFFYALHV